MKKLTLFLSIILVVLSSPFVFSNPNLPSTDSKIISETMKIKNSESPKLSNDSKVTQEISEECCETRTATAQCGEETIEVSHTSCAMNCSLAASAAQRGADAIATAWMYVCESN